MTESPEMRDSLGSTLRKPYSTSPEQGGAGMPNLPTPQHNDVIYKFHAPGPCNWVARKQIEKQNYGILNEFMNK